MEGDIDEVTIDIDEQVNVGDAHLVEDPEDCCKFLSGMNNEYKVIAQNIRSLNCNFSDFQVLLARLKINFDIIVLTECWLPHVINPPIIHNFTAFSSTKHINQNCGVVVYVRKTIQNITVSEPETADANCLVIEILNKCAFICLYRTPSKYCIQNFKTSLDLVLTAHKNYKNLILIGDINVDIVDDTTDNRAPGYLGLLAIHGLLPGHTFATHDQTCIDHCFLKLENKSTTLVCRSTVTDHSAVIVSLKLGHFSPAQKIKIITKIDYDKALLDLKNINWTDVLPHDDPNEMAHTFLTIVTSILHKYTTTHKSPCRTNTIKPWITKGLLRCMKFRDKLHWKHKKKT